MAWLKTVQLHSDKLWFSGTTKDTAAAARFIWANGIMAALGALLFFFIGTGLYAFITPTRKFESHHSKRPNLPNVHRH